MAETDLQEQLIDLVAKIDAEGLDYFLVEYGGVSRCPEAYGLKRLAAAAADALGEFETHLKQACADHDVEYEL